MVRGIGEHYFVQRDSFVHRDPWHINLKICRRIEASLSSNESFLSTPYGISVPVPQRHNSLYSSLSTSCRLYKSSLCEGNGRISARSLQSSVSYTRLRKRNTEGRWFGEGDKKRNILFIIVLPPGGRCLSPLTLFWKLTCTLQLHYEKLKNAVSEPQVVRECCLEPRGKLVYILITAEYKLNINFRPDEIFWNCSGMYIPRKVPSYFSIPVSL
jgi:hypothetical protein